MGKIDDLRIIQKLGRFNDKKKAEDYYANLNMNFKNAGQGIFRIKQIMKKFNLPFATAYECALDSKQLEILKTMKSAA